MLASHILLSQSFCINLSTCVMSIGFHWHLQLILVTHCKDFACRTWNIYSFSFEKLQRHSRTLFQSPSTCQVQMLHSSSLILLQSSCKLYCLHQTNSAPMAGTGPRSCLLEHNHVMDQCLVQYWLFVNHPCLDRQNLQNGTHCSNISCLLNWRILFSLCNNA